MVITASMLMDDLAYYSDPAGRILRMKKMVNCSLLQEDCMKPKGMYRGIVWPELFTVRPICLLILLFLIMD